MIVKMIKYVPSKLEGLILKRFELFGNDLSPLPVANVHKYGIIAPNPHPIHDTISENSFS